MARVELNQVVFRRDTLTDPIELAAGSSVQVNVRNAAAATVYLAATGAATLTNPLTADASARVEGWVEQGSYDLVVSLSGHPTYTERFEAVSGDEGRFFPEFYGALGDGATNDKAAIEAVHAAASAAGGTVELGAKTYRVVGQLVLDDSNADVIGKGAMATVIDTDDGVHFGPTSGAGTASDIRLRFLKIKRRNTGFGAATDFRHVHYSGYDHCRIESENMAAVIGNAVDTVTPTNIEIDHNVMTAKNNAIFSEVGTDGQESGYISITHNRIYQLTASDIGVELWIGGSEVSHNYIIGLGTALGSIGLTLGGVSSPNTKAISNHIYGFQYGLEIGNTKRGTVATGNSIRACQIGILLSGTSGETEAAIGANSVTIDDAWTGGGTLYGVYVQGFKAVTLTGVTVHYKTTLPYTDVASRAHIGFGAGSSFKRATLVGCNFTNLADGAKAAATNPKISYVGCVFDNVMNVTDQTGGGVSTVDRYSGCIFHNCGYCLVNGHIVYDGCEFDNEADFTFVNKPPAECLPANQCTTTIMGNCRFTNVSTTCFATDVNYGSGGATYNRPKIEFRDDRVSAGWNITDWSAVDAVFTAAGVTVPVDFPIYTPFSAKRHVKTNHGVVTNGTAAPTTGTWAVGDKVYSTTPAAAGNIGWVCTTAGTPGTWKTFGAIAA